MTRKLLALVHFSPIELYPPVQNLLNELSKEELKVYVFTTSNKRFAIDRIPPVDRNIVVKRISKITRFPNWWMRTLRYTCFYGYVFLWLFLACMCLLCRTSSCVYVCVSLCACSSSSSCFYLHGGVPPMHFRELLRPLLHRGQQPGVVCKSFLLQQ